MFCFLLDLLHERCTSKGDGQAVLDFHPYDNDDTISNSDSGSGGMVETAVVTAHQRHANYLV